MTYAFRLMTADDLPQVNGWIAGPEVAAWWEDPIDPEDLHEADTRLWIVQLDGADFAYLQDYDPHAHPGHHFAHLPPDSRGMDQFIGRPELIGRGHGSAFIRTFVDRLFAEGAPAVGTDPDPTNARAIRAYEKAGFVAVGAPRNTEWGFCQLMERRR